MMRFISTAFVVFCIFWPSVESAKAQEGFSGKLQFTKLGCEATRDCILKNNFLYRDPNGLEWQANKGNITDGASIPSLAQPFVGKPFDSSFIKAAVIHDHYCDRNVRSWWSTHRVFYHALIHSGVEKKKAKVMYLAVVVGGPKWITLIEASTCGSGQACANSLTRTAIYSREAQYDKPEFENSIQAKANEILSNPEMSLDEIDKAALEIQPDDFFLTRGDSLVLKFGSPDYFKFKELFGSDNSSRFENFKIQND